MKLFSALFALLAVVAALPSPDVQAFSMTKIGQTPRKAVKCKPREVYCLAQIVKDLGMTPSVVVSPNQLHKKTLSISHTSHFLSHLSVSPFPANRHQVSTRRRSFTDTATNNTSKTHNHATGASVLSQCHIAQLDWALGDQHSCAMRDRATASHIDAMEHASLENVYDDRALYC
ncbi:hypothetical protein IQ07DRAFT_584329 [Pyrenochaeta sp. DS3sAY3a]|nr:hypothetical protein IQ07DRAFT_584329 [Pyrenochaeta sp. DS3sAY3a]